MDGRYGPYVKWEKVNATLRLRRIDWHSVAIKGAGNNVRYRNELRRVDLFRTNAPVQTLVREGAEWRVDPQSSAIALPPFARSARYLLEAEGMDSHWTRSGRSVAAIR